MNLLSNRDSETVANPSFETRLQRTCNPTYTILEEQTLLFNTTRNKSFGKKIQTPSLPPSHQTCPHSCLTRPASPNLPAVPERQMRHACCQPVGRSPSRYLSLIFIITSCQTRFACCWAVGRSHPGCLSLTLTIPTCQIRCACC